MTDQANSISKTSITGPRAGDLFRLPFGGEGLVGWALLKTHPDDADVFLCVPADLETAFLADEDTVVENGEEALVLRCNHSLWLRAEDFWERVDGYRVLRTDRIVALQRVRWIAGLDELEEPTGTADFDECQSDWLREVIAPALSAARRWRGRVTRRFGTRDASLSASTPSRLQLVRSPAAPMPLAASGRGVFHSARELARRLDPRSIAPTTADLASWSFWVDAAGVQPCHAGPEAPPVGWAWPQAGRRRRTNWTRAEDGNWFDQSLEWGDGAVRFAFDGGDAAPGKGGSDSGVAFELILENEEGELELDSDVAPEDAGAAANPGAFLDSIRAGLIEGGCPQGQVDLRVRAAARLLAESGLTLAPGDRLAYRATCAVPLRAGVVGLVVDLRTEPPVGLVTRLRARPMREWRVDRELPLDAHRLSDLLARLHHAGGVQLDAGLPERFAFELRAESVGQIAGPSMDIAALLALLDGLDGHRHPLLRAACSLAQEAQRGGERGNFVAVEHYAEKLDAFRREIGHGSLLVCPTSIDAADTEGFGEVWRVDAWEDLARQLDSVGLLSVLFESHELRREEHLRVVNRLRKLCSSDKRYREARDLAGRLEACVLAESVPVAERWLGLQRCSDPARLLGLAEEALNGNRKLVDEMRASGSLASHEQLADAENHLASAYFEAHRFEESCGLLTPWIDRIESDARLLTSSLRARLLTVAARAASVRGQVVAVEWMRTAVALQERANDPFASRTLGHLVEVLLRLGRDDEAEEALDRAWSQQGCDNDLLDHSDWFLAMFRAELARRRGELWSDPRLDALEPEPDGSSLWVLAGYQQAVARQSGRSSEERVDRLRRSARFAGSSAARDGVYQLLSDLLERCANALDGQQTRSTGSGAITLTGPIGDWYRDALRELDRSPSLAAVDALLTRVPHFAGPCGA